MEPPPKRLKYTPNVQDALVDAKKTVNNLCTEGHVDPHAHTELVAALDHVVEADAVQKTRIGTNIALELAAECSTALGIMLRSDANMHVDLISKTFVRKLLHRRSELDGLELNEDWVEELIDFHMCQGSSADELISIVCLLLESQGGVDIVPGLLAYFPKFNCVFTKLCDKSGFDMQQCQDAAYTLVEYDPRLVDWIAPKTDTTPRAIRLRSIFGRL